MRSKHVGDIRTLKGTVELWKMCVGDRSAWCQVGNRADVTFRAYDLKNVTHIASFLSLMCF